MKKYIANFVIREIEIPRDTVRSVTVEVDESDGRNKVLREALVRLGLGQLETQGYLNGLKGEVHTTLVSYWGAG